MRHGQPYILSIATIALVAGPSNAVAQGVGTCSVCVDAEVFSLFGDPQACEGSFSGAEGCAQPEAGDCDLYGDQCESAVRYVLTSGRVIVRDSRAGGEMVRRSCDGAIVHRTYTAEGIRRIMQRLQLIELAPQ